MTNPISRRRLLEFVTFTPLLWGNLSGIAEEQKISYPIKQSVAYGAFRSIPLDLFAKRCKEIGLVGIDLVNPNEWEIVMQNGLIVTMSRAPGASMSESFNHIEYHDKTETIYAELLPLAGKANVKNMICFSGNRKGISEEEGLENCVKGIKRVVPIAEKNGVTLHMELLNSFGHKDYQADHTAWGAEVVRRVGSEHFKLLYDIYHMQVMEGNLIDTIRKNQEVIGHYHTAGCPGRKDLDETQEIYYPAVMKAICETKFQGYVAHEFSPKKNDKLESLVDAVNVCRINIEQ
ncbi:MAG: TIM barrel protein [Planctomycetaceae bacterium]|jgi:hydroxypyruvate isomerase|nr:TIM barrel protein [Planctomycetaceae bacterium]